MPMSMHIRVQVTRSTSFAVAMFYSSLEISEPDLMKSTCNVFHRNHTHTLSTTIFMAETGVFRALVGHFSINLICTRFDIWTTPFKHLIVLPTVLHKSVAVVYILKTVTN